MSRPSGVWLARPRRGRSAGTRERRQRRTHELVAGGGPNMSDEQSHEPRPVTSSTPWHAQPLAGRSGAPDRSSQSNFSGMCERLHAASIASCGRRERAGRRRRSPTSARRWMHGPNTLLLRRSSSPSFAGSARSSLMRRSEGGRPRRYTAERTHWQRPGTRWSETCTVVFRRSELGFRWRALSWRRSRTICSPRAVDPRCLSNR